MTHGELVFYPLRRAVRGLLSLRFIGQEDRLSLEAIDADAVRLTEVYGEGTQPDFGVIGLVSAAGALYAQAGSIAAKYRRPPASVRAPIVRPGGG
ncbi:hypothetical protein [Mycolicibacterium llatzerense]|uniref:hypothetical protein n=1 Tax=Mycolicibacterium llatzerense TaxID=280871 RepID=UPI0013A69D94|nr:hypothetical protein [Mycolicibacterium llatzerense]